MALFYNSFLATGFAESAATEVICRRGLFKKFCNIHRKVPVLESLFNKAAVLRPISKNICERLLLFLENLNEYVVVEPYQIESMYHLSFLRFSNLDNGQSFIIWLLCFLFLLS